ncbi:sulfite exporter TauE/SafE family protein [Marinicellulosiphila megalodicopiae]|uniref:sulfite exporter TauE/SafE family protein n=1 Tax=Marinicellulosiphila megalodicopiae TaxID=2724896 RepID=UPI003BB21C5A
MFIIEFLIANLDFILAGAGVGLVVGITGVGGGALMTPILILFGIPHKIAIGTDLIYAAITKGSGMVSHARQGHVKWSVVAKLSAGSIPGALLTFIFLKRFEDVDYTHILTQALGIMLVITALVLFFRPHLKQLSVKQKLSPRAQLILTVALGLFVGSFVTLSSVGAGALGTAILMVLFPILLPKEVVGTDIAHAVPLTFIAGMFHYSLGNVDWYLLISLIIGSIPMVMLGAKLSTRIPSKIMHPFLASLLMILGVIYALDIDLHNL